MTTPRTMETVSRAAERAAKRNAERRARHAVLAAERAAATAERAAEGSDGQPQGGRAVTAAAAVHTTGVNWESVAAIAACVAVIMSVVIWVFNRRDKQNQRDNEAIRNDITTAVSGLGELLLAKLETKETVARISERLARLEGAAHTPDSSH